MAKVFGIHMIALRPDVKAEDFETFVAEEANQTQNYPGVNGYTLKGIKGDREGRYLVLIEIESVETFERFISTDGTETEAAKQWKSNNPEAAKRNAELIEKWNTFAHGFGVIYTDYIEVE